MMPVLVLLGILDLEALAALLWVFFTPSETGRGLFLWLSGERLLLVTLLFVICLGLLTVTLQAVRSRASVERRLAALDDFLIRGRWLAPALIYLTAVPIVIAIAAGLVLRTPPVYAAYQTWAPDTFPLLRSIIGASFPLFAFLVVTSLEIAAFLAIRCRRAFFTPSLWAWDAISTPLLVLLIALVTALHWLVLTFQLRFFVNIPGWYWRFDPVAFSPGDVWYLLGAMVLVALAYWALIVRHRLAVGLPVLLALGCFLQMGVGWMGGSGMAALRERYFTTYHQAYVAAAAAGSTSVLDNIQQYDRLYGSNTFTTTKPPGLMAFYIGLDHLVNGFPSIYSIAARYARLSDVIVWLFPLLAVGLVVLLWAFAGRLTQEPSGWVACVAPFLVVLVPSLALFTFFADQALYPSIFLLGVWITVRVIRSGSLAWSAFLGALLYVAALFSYAMLLLYTFAGLYLLLYIWKERPAGRLRRMLLTGLGIAAGTLVMYWLGFALLNYDFISHFRRMASINHNFDFYLRVGQQPPVTPESLAVRLGQIGRAAWLNNLDFAAAIGFPIYILFAVQAVRRLRGLITPGLLPADVVMLALLASFLVLNLAGTAQGEVPRLWLFWLPMVALLAAFELEPHLRRRPWLLLPLGATQIITLMLTFHFQDLRM